MLSGKNILIVLIAVIVWAIAGPAQANKSVYAITNHPDSTIGAFKTVNDELEYQTETNLHFAFGALNILKKKT